MERTVYPQLPLYQYYHPLAREANSNHLLVTFRLSCMSRLLRDVEFAMIF